MLELKAAPSPNPALPAANAANANPANAGEAAGPDAATGEQGMNFAAVLKEHVGKETSDKKIVAAVQALLAAQAEATPATEAPTDPIALLAPMLAGIAVPQSAKAEVADVAPTTDDTDPDDVAAAVIAAPMTAPTVPHAAPVAEQAAAPNSAVVDSLPHEGDAPLPAAANIAAETAASAEGKSKHRGTESGFEALIDAAKEARVMADPHAPVRAPQAATPAPASTAVATPVGAPGWDSEVGDKVAWMVGRNETRAELVLNPPQLGRVEVSLSLNGDQANATFTSANASVREALENAMPRLREVLQNAGISLGQTQVGSESFQQSAERQQGNNGQARGQDRDDRFVPGLALGHETAPGQWQKRGNGLVDTFA